MLLFLLLLPLSPWNALFVSTLLSVWCSNSKNECASNRIEQSSNFYVPVRSGLKMAGKTYCNVYPPSLTSIFSPISSNIFAIEHSDAHCCHVGWFVPLLFHFLSPLASRDPSFRPIKLFPNKQFLSNSKMELEEESRRKKETKALWDHEKVSHV